MRVERHDCRGQVAFMGDLGHTCKNGLMSAMNAIKIADCQYRSLYTAPQYSPKNLHDRPKKAPIITAMGFKRSGATTLAVVIVRQCGLAWLW